jgi:NADPH-dependent glutamate synthase beta subunit-like oxidoreductase
VAIKTVEQAIADKAYEFGFIVPQPATVHTGKKVAIIGSGPSGLAAAQQLGRAGHEVHVYERETKPGGLLRYGIPDFKMEKHHIDRRVKQMEGRRDLHVQRQCRRHQGRDIVCGFDAVSTAVRNPRDAYSGVVSLAFMTRCLI